MISRLRVLAFGVAVAAMLGAAGLVQVSAQNMPSKIDDKAKAAAVAKERSEFMESLGKNEKILVAVMKGQAPLDAQAVDAAEKQAKATQDLLSHFNPGTGDDMVNGSRARAIIWTEWDKFKELASAVPPAAAAALVAAKSGDQKAFAEKEMVTVNACAACHKVYRAPRQR